MEATTVVQTARETATQNVIDSVRERTAKEHEQNYHKLHVLRDGSVSWFEAINLGKCV